MNSMQVRCFLSAAQCLNFTLAASKLYVTQSTLSKNIAALEQELEGQVWELTVAEEQLPDVAQYGTVCGVSRQQEGILVRLLSAAKPPLPCAPARPDLEDVYLFHFGEGATL